jgi:3-deoxy-D-manno-octulosonic-acid transferase
VAIGSLKLTIAQRLLYGAYSLVWHLALPLALLYLWWRGRKEPLYRQFIGERFGRVHTQLVAPVWLHSASLGELRGVMPLIDKLLAENLPVLITTLTPAGRSAAQARYAQEIAAHRLQVSYLPLELAWAVRAFARAVQARCMISSEIDTWPVLLRTLKAQGLPLAFVNAQYPKKSFEKDQGWAGVRAAFFAAYDLVLCKSQLHAQRFLHVGCPRVEVVGELRFDLPIPQPHLQAAQALRAQISAERPVLCMASVVEGEDAWMLDAFSDWVSALKAAGQPTPLLVYVPRSPQRFDGVAQLLVQRAWRVQRRSVLLDRALQAKQAVNWGDIDILLGDSLGEMYFYLALADSVTVCGSFLSRGSHNVIEPLALRKPVIVGPSIWGIEYPGQEALAAGVLAQVASADELPRRWQAQLSHNAAAQSNTDRSAHAQRAAQFMAEHSGSVDKHWKHLQAWLPTP